jgi:hypothetical protein
MSTQENNLYEAPMAEVLEVKDEGIICASGGASPNDSFSGGGNPFNP